MYGVGPQGLLRRISERTHAKGKYIGGPGRVFYIQDEALKNILEEGDVAYMDKYRLIYLFISSDKRIGMHNMYLSRDTFAK